MDTFKPRDKSAPSLKLIFFLSLVALFVAPGVGPVLYLQMEKDRTVTGWLYSFVMGPGMTLLFLEQVFGSRRKNGSLELGDAVVLAAATVAYWVSLVAIVLCIIVALRK